MFPSAPEPVDADGVAVQRFTIQTVHASPEFGELRRRSRRFTFVAATLILAWFLLLFWAVGYQPEFMAREVIGHFTVGMLFAWSQVLTTLLAAYLFCRHSRVCRQTAAELTSRLDQTGDGHAADSDR